MFFAIELNVRSIRLAAAARPLHPSKLDTRRKILRDEHAVVIANRRSKTTGLFADNASSKRCLKPVPSSSSHSPSPVSLRPPKVRLPTRPPERARTHCGSLSQGARTPPYSGTFCPNSSPRPPPTKIPARQTRHARSPPSHGTPMRDPPSFSVKACADSTPAPSCPPSASAGARPQHTDLHYIVLRHRPLNRLADLVMTALFPMCSGIQARSSGTAAAAFLPRSASSVA